MDLRFFFEGMLDREESVSAYLAMLLDGSRAFREAFLRAAWADRTFVDPGGWHVDVEDGNVDVRMTTDGLEVVIENKIQAGSVEQGQLLAYYRQAVERAPATRRIAAVYVAPRTVGRFEVEEVVAALRPGDVAVHISWEGEIGHLIEAMPAGADRELAMSGFREVCRIIETRRLGLAWTDERAEVRRVARTVADDLRAACPDVPVSSWPSLTQEAVHTPTAWPFNLWLTIEFTESGPPDHVPLTRLPDGRRSVTLRSRFRKGPTVEDGSALARRWGEHRDGFDVPGVGLYQRLDRGGWYARAETFVGTSEEMAARLVAIGTAVVAALHGLGT